MFATPLHRAAYSAHEQIVPLLFASADPNACCPDGRPALSLASGLSPAISFLAQVTAKTVDALGQSPLHRAAMRGDSALYDTLKAAGYDAELCDVMGFTPAQYMRESLFADHLLDVPLSRLEIQRTLQHDPNRPRRNPLASALLHGWFDLAQRLLDGGADPDLPLASGQTPRAIGLLRQTRL